MQISRPWESSSKTKRLCEPSKSKWLTRKRLAKTLTGRREIPLANRQRLELSQKIRWCSTGSLRARSAGGLAILRLAILKSRKSLAWADAAQAQKEVAQKEIASANQMLMICWSFDASTRRVISAASTAVAN